MAACPRWLIAACELQQELLIVSNYYPVSLAGFDLPSVLRCLQRFSARGSGPSSHAISGGNRCPAYVSHLLCLRVCFPRELQQCFLTRTAAVLFFNLDCRRASRLSLQPCFTAFWLQSNLVNYLDSLYVVVRASCRCSTEGSSVLAVHVVHCRVPGGRLRANRHERSVQLGPPRSISGSASSGRDRSDGAGQTAAAPDSATSLICRPRQDRSRSPPPGRVRVWWM